MRGSAIIYKLGKGNNEWAFPVVADYAKIM
jgi:hypothetical protein